VEDPHTLIVLRLDDGTACTLDWNGLSSLTNDRNIGPAKAAALVFGARIAVTGNAIWSSAQSPPRDNSYAAEIALLKDSLRRRVAWIEIQLDTSF